MAFKMKNPSLMKMAKEAGSAMKLKKEPMKMKKAAPMKEMKGDLDKDGKLSGYEANRQNKIEEAMEKDSSNKMKKDPAMKLKKDNAMKMKKDPAMKLKKEEPMKMKKAPMKMGHKKK